MADAEYVEKMRWSVNAWMVDPHPRIAVSMDHLFGRSCVCEPSLNSECASEDSRPCAQHAQRPQPGLSVPDSLGSTKTQVPLRGILRRWTEDAMSHIARLLPCSLLSEGLMEGSVSHGPPG